MRRWLSRISVWHLFALVAVSALADDQNVSPIGHHVEGFSLQDFRGKAHALADFQESKLLVISFLGVECPLSKLYGLRLAELSREFSEKGVAFIGVDSNRQDAVTEMAHFAKTHNISFPFLKDLNNTLADQLKATRNPQVFVLDADRIVRYAGRVDDQYGFQTGSGYAKPKVTRSDLALALEELLAGKEITLPSTPAVGCLIGRVRPAQQDSAVTYSNQIARIFQKHCVECHRPGQIGPFTLENYESASGWAEMIAEVIRDQRMPPWHADPRYGHFRNDPTLSDSEQEQIYAWVAAGAPEGNREELPPPLEYAGSWMMPGGPDQVFYMTEQPVDVPAEGTVDYQYFTVDPKFTEDKWVKVAECMPGNRAVVHHIIVFLRPPEPDAGGQERFGSLCGYAPGTRPHVLMPGMAKLIPKGYQFVFQMHYTPNGSPQQDRSAVGLKFEDPDNVTHRVATANAINMEFEIPANASDYPVTADREFQREVLLLSMFPHMHLRGKDFLYEVTSPGGQKETLLNVPRYDFNWQTSFIYEEPRRLPAGTKLHCTAHFDNSAENLANPDPSKPVRWGDQTWEEMMIGWVDIAVPREVNLSEVLPPRPQKK